MQIEGSTFSNTSFLGHSQETSPLRNKNWEGLVQAGLLAVWTCSCRVWAPLLGGILQHYPQVLATSAQLSHMPQGVQPSFSISCYENASLEGVTLSSCCPRYLETKATKVSAHSYLWQDRSTALPLWGILGPRVALDGCSPSAFWGVRAEKDTHSPSTPLGLRDGGHIAANTPTRCSQVQNGFSELWFFVKGTCRST